MTTELKPCILIIEDDATCQKMHTLLVTQQGYCVDLASTGEKAVTMTTEKHYALILTDMGLPGIDGFETVRQIRQQVTNRFTPIIAITAHAVNQEDQQRSLTVGIDQVIEKPLTSKKLADILAKHLATNSLQDSEQQIVENSHLEWHDLPTLDINRVIQLMGISQAEALNLQQQFVDDLHEHYDIFLQPATLANQRKIKQSVHKINGGANFGGAFRLQKLCSKLEYTWRYSNEKEEAEKILSAIIQEIEQVFSAYKR